jgi:molybdopterin-guanine dinucleotide biosynthesis protein A
MILSMINMNAMILAGGRSSRMGVGSKALIRLGDKVLLEHVIQRLQPQVNHLAVSGDTQLLTDVDCPIIEDKVAKFSGPLAGLYSGLLDQRLSSAEYLLLAPCDGPFIPDNLADELYGLILSQNADVACVRYENVVQATFSLWRKRTVTAVKKALLSDHNGGFKPLLGELNTVYFDWAYSPVNPFFNINTPDDLNVAERILCL